MIRAPLTRPSSYWNEASDLLLGWKLKLPRPPFENSCDALDIDLPLGHINCKSDDLALRCVNRKAVEVVEDNHRKHRGAFVAVEKGMFRISECIRAAAFVWMSG